MLPVEFEFRQKAAGTVAGRLRAYRSLIKITNKAPSGQLVQKIAGGNVITRAEFYLNAAADFPKADDVNFVAPGGQTQPGYVGSGSIGGFGPGYTNARRRGGRGTARG
ncbi:MAG: hypothetical protein Kow0059_02830 [Candidatus Sumerlaeia bacterium]